MCSVQFPSISPNLTIPTLIFGGFEGVESLLKAAFQEEKERKFE
jgi:hypothetical protein